VLIEKISAPLGFRQMQAEDLSDWPHGGNHDNFERIVTALEGLRGAPAAAANRSSWTRDACEYAVDA